MNDTTPFIAAPSNASIICFTDADCLNAGACSLAATINATCQCFRGYWGSNCAKGLYDLQGPLLIIHQVVMIPIFLALTIVAGINLAAAIILTKRASGRVVDRMVSILFGFALFGCFGLENILYGLCLWALESCGIIIIAAWVILYNKMNPRAPVKWFRRSAALAIFVLFGLSVGTDAARYYSTASQRNIFGWVYRVSLVVFAIGFSAWFLYYGRKMYKTLEMFKGSAVNARLMDKIYFIARTTAIFTVMFVFIQIGSNVAQIAFASIHVFLPYQFLFRLQEAGYYIIIFKTFNFHEQWKVAFRSRSRSSTAATALSGKRTGSVNTGTATASKSSGSTKSGGSDELEPLTSMVL